MEDDEGFRNHYWLVPGLETVHGNLNVRVGTANGSTTGNLMDTYSVGSWNSNRNCPRSMAVAYSYITIDGCSIHLTEISRDASNITYTTKGWTNDIQVKVYGFCEIDASGTPTTASPPAFVWTVDDPPGVPAGTTNEGVTPTPAPATEGFCKPFKPPDSLRLVVGNDVGGPGRPVYLAVSVAIGAQARVPDNWGLPVQGGPGYPDSRTISVTLHGHADRVENMNLQA